MSVRDVTKPADHEVFYAEFTERNRGLIGSADQERLRRATIVIAGCGSTGGACAMPLLRTGAEHFILLDPGAYELNNLNRQDAVLADIGQNKAVATAARLESVNPFVSCEVHTEGVTPSNIEGVLKATSLVIDAVDVTTSAGVVAKYALHRAACRARLPVVTAYDIAGTQFLELYDYRSLRVALRGRMQRDADPTEALRRLIPPWVVPREIFPVLLERRADPDRGFPQLVMTSTLLGALIVPYAVRILAGQRVRRRLHVDLNQVMRPIAERPGELVSRSVGLVALLRKLRA